MINLFLELNEIIEGTEKDCLDPPKKMISVSKMSDLTDRYDARVITIIILWYFWSGCTLYLNKYLVDYQDADATLLSSIQMGMIYLYIFYDICCFNFYLSFFRHDDHNWLFSTETFIWVVYCRTSEIKKTFMFKVHDPDRGSKICHCIFRTVCSEICRSQFYRNCKKHSPSIYFVNI